MGKKKTSQNSNILQPSFGPSVDSVCHPCITTTRLSYSPIVSYLWNFRHRLVQYYWFINVYKQRRMNSTVWQFFPSTHSSGTSPNKLWTWISHDFTTSAGDLISMLTRRTWQVASWSTFVSSPKQSLSQHLNRVAFFGPMQCLRNAHFDFMNAVRRAHDSIGHQPRSSKLSSRQLITLSANVFNGQGEQALTRASWAATP